MTAELTIQLAVTERAEQAADLWLRGVLPNEPADTYPGNVSIKERLGYRYALVLDSEKSVYGGIELALAGREIENLREDPATQQWLTQNVLMINRIGVEEGDRQRGLARRLINSVVVEAKYAGFTVLCGVAEQNLTLRHTYSRLGFTLTTVDAPLQLKIDTRAVDLPLQKGANHFWFFQNIS